MAVAAAVAAVAAARQAGAATQIWDPGKSGASGGSGTWDLATPNWDTGTQATTGQTWANGNAAVFNGPGGAVNVVTGVGANSLFFNQSGYSLTGGTLELNGSSPVFTYANVSSPATLTISAVLDGTAGVTFAGQSSSYAYALTGANSYTGTTVVRQSTVQFSTLSNAMTNSSFGQSGEIDLGGSTTLASGSTTVLTYTGSATGATDRLLGLTGTSVNNAINNSGTGPLSFNNTGVATEGVAGARTLNLGGSNTTSINTFAESLTDLGTGTSVTSVIVKAGIWTLSGTSSTYSGGTNLSAGTTIITSAASLGTGPVSFPGTAGYLNASSGLTLTNAMSTTVGTASGTAQLRSTAAVGTTVNFSGPISGSGNVQVATLGSTKAGAIELSDDASSFTGTLTTGIGLVQYTSVANGGSVSSLGAGTSAYVLNNATSSATFQYVGTVASTTTRAINWSASGTSTNAGPLVLDASGTGTVQFLNTSTGLRSGSSAAILTLSGTNTGLNTLAQVVNDGATGATSGTFATSLTKTGAGKWVLTGVNTYTGGTTVSAGTLVADGATAALGTAATTVGGTGVLAGTGNTGSGSVVINTGGTVTAGTGATPSDTPGTLTTGVQSWNAGGGYVTKFASASSGDVLLMSGLTINATNASGSRFTVTPINLQLATGGTIVIATDTNAAGTSVADPFAAAINAGGLVLGTTTSSATGDPLSLSSTADGGGFELVLNDVAAAPEPTSLLLAGVAAAPLALARRRRTPAR